MKRTTNGASPLVSVVIPCYNAERTLAHALDSALAQAEDVPLEIILIDDGCTDGTAALMRQYLRGKARPKAPAPGEAQGEQAGACPEGTGRGGICGAEYPQIRIIRHEKSAGAAAGRNDGVAAALGKYVAFLDADDIWAEGKLKAQVEIMEGPMGLTGGSGDGQCHGGSGGKSHGETDPDGKKDSSPPLCCTARELMTPEGRLTGRVIPVKERISYRRLLTHNSINCSSVLIRSDIARAFPMEHEDSHEDYITWLKVVREHGPAAGINRPYLKYRLSSSGKSGSKLKSAGMTYTAYRYAGLGPVRAAACFGSYVLHGLWKYWHA